jgi:hypothetical protein
VLQSIYLAGLDLGLGAVLAEGIRKIRDWC